MLSLPPPPAFWLSTVHSLIGLRLGAEPLFLLRKEPTLEAGGSCHSPHEAL